MALKYKFNGYQFHPHTPDGMVPRPMREAVFSREHIPYSNADVLDVGGLGPLVFRCTAQLLSYEVSNFERQLGKVAVLEWDNILVWAYFSKLDNLRMHYYGTHYWCDVEFIEGTVGFEDEPVSIDF